MYIWRFVDSEEGLRACRKLLQAKPKETKDLEKGWKFLPRAAVEPVECGYKSIGPMRPRYEGCTRGVESPVKDAEELRGGSRTTNDACCFRLRYKDGPAEVTMISQQVTRHKQWKLDPHIPDFPHTVDKSQGPTKGKHFLSVL